MNKIKFSGEYQETLMDLNIEPEPPPQPEVPAQTGISVSPESEADDAVQRFLKVVQSIDVRTGTHTRFNRHLNAVDSEIKPQFQQQKMQNKPAPKLQAAYTASAAELLACMAPVDDDGLMDPLALLLKPKKNNVDDADKDEERGHDYSEEE